MAKNEKIEKLYSAFSEDYELGTLEDFYSKMSDPKKRESFYNAVSNDVEGLPSTFEVFNSDIENSYTDDESVDEKPKEQEQEKTGFLQRIFGNTQQAQMYVKQVEDAKKKEEEEAARQERINTGITEKDKKDLAELSSLQEQASNPVPIDANGVFNVLSHEPELNQYGMPTNATKSVNPDIERQIETKKAQMPAYLTRGEDNLESIQANAIDRALGTEEGKKLMTTINNKYAEEFKNSETYKSLMTNFYAGKISEEDIYNFFSENYSSKVYGDFYKAIASEGGMMHDYMKDAENKLKTKLASEDAYGLQTEIEKAKEEQNQQHAAEYDERYKKAFGVYPHEDPLRELHAKGFSASGGYRTNLTTGNLKYASEFNEKALTMIDAVAKNKGFFGGLGDAVTDMDTWDLGIGEIARSASLMEVLDKVENDKELTKDEQLMFDAALNYFAVSTYYSDKVGRGYKAGQTTGASLPFMIQFVMSSGTTAAIDGALKSGANAITKKIVKAMLKGGKKKLAKAVTSDVSKMAGRAVGGAVMSGIDAALLTSTFGLGKIEAGTLQRQIGQVRTDFDSQTNQLKYEGREKAQTREEARKNAIIDTYVEYFSEMALTNTLSPVGSYIRGTELFKDIAKGDIAGTIIDIWNNPVWRSMRQTTKFGSLPEEVFEEELGGLLRLSASDVNTAKEAGLDLDSQIDIVLGLAPTSIFFGGVGAVSHYGKLWSGKREFRASLTTEEEKELFDRLMKESRSGEFGDLAHNLIRTIVQDTQMSQEAKKMSISSIVAEYHDLLSKETQELADQVTASGNEKIIDDYISQARYGASDNIYQTIDNRGRVLVISDGKIEFSRVRVGQGYYIVADPSKSEGKVKVRYVNNNGTLTDEIEINVADLTAPVTELGVDEFKKFKLAQSNASSSEQEAFEFEGGMYNTSTGEYIDTKEEYEKKKAEAEANKAPTVDTKPHKVNQTVSVTINGEKKTVKIVSGNLTQNEDGSIKGGTISISVDGNPVTGERKKSIIDNISELFKAEHSKAVEEFNKRKEEENAVEPTTLVSEEDKAIADTEAQREAERQIILASAQQKKAKKYTPEETVVVLMEQGNDVAIRLVGSRIDKLHAQIDEINADENKDELEKWEDSKELSDQLAAYEQAITKWLGQETLDAINAARAQALQNTPPVQGESPAVPAEQAPVVEPAQDETPADAPAGPDTTPLPLHNVAPELEGTEGEQGGDGETPAPDTLGEEGGVEGNEEGEEPAPAADKPTANLDEVTVWVAKNYDYIVTDKEGNTIFSSKPTRKKVTDAFEELHQVEGKVDGKRGTYNGEDCIIVRDNPAKGYVNIVTPHGIERVGREEVMIDGKPLKGKASVVEWRENNEKKYDTFESIMSFPVFDIRGEMNITFLDFLNTTQDSPYVAFYEMLRKHYREKYNDDVAQQYLDASVARLIENLKEVARLWNIVRTKRLISSGQMPTTLERKKMDSQSKRMKEAVAAVHNAVGLGNGIDFSGLVELAEKAAKKAEKKGEGEGYFAETDEEKAESYVDGLVSNILWVGFEAENKHEHEDAVEGIVEALNKESKKASKQRELVVNILNDRLEEAKRLNRLNDIQAIERVIDRLSTLKKMKPLLTEAGLIEEKGKKTPTKPAPKKDISALEKQLSIEENSLRDLEEDYKRETDEAEKSELEGYIAQAKEKIAKLKAEIDGAEFMVGDVVAEHAESTKRIIKILKAAGIRVVTFKNEDLPKYVSKKKLEELSDGQIVYGFASNDTIYLNEDHFNPNSPLHEFTHLWVTAYKQAFPEEWKRFVEIANKSALAANLRKPLKDGNASPYAKLSADEMTSEVLSRYTGYLYGELDSEGRTAFENMMQAQTMEEKIAEKSLLNRIRNIWKKIISWFDKSIENEKKEDVIDDMIRQFAQLPMETLARGREAVDELKQIAVVSKLDAEYMDAVNRGDMETAQRLVNEAARMSMPNTKVVDENGNPLIVFHGSPYSNITTFDHTKGSQESGLKEFGTYFTSNPLLAELYKNGRNISEEMQNKIDGEIAKLQEQQNNVRNNREYDALENEINLLKQAKEGKVYPCFLNIETPKEFDAKHQDGWAGWRELKQDVGYDVKRGTEAIEAITGNNKSAVMDEQYDGIIAHDIMDIHSNELKEELFGDAYLVWNPTQIKSAEPITYDDNGNFIPLSERFNLESDDMRYMLEINTPENLDNSKKSSTFAENNENYERTDEFRELQERSLGLSQSDIARYQSEQIVLSDEDKRGIGGVFQRLMESERNGGRNGQWINLTGKGNQFKIAQVNPAIFHDIFQICRNYLPNGELVDLHDNYADCKCFISEDGLCGFAIEPDGNLISVFSLNPRDKKGFLYAIKDLIRQEGATHLDCFVSNKQPLSEIYQKVLGFHVASEMDYNMEFDHDNIAENHGMPKVAFMVDKPTEKREFDKDSYDAAAEYQLSQTSTAEREQIIAEAKANGTFMMHNGQPTNLTEDQWVTVRTQAFKDYFGDWINDKDNASVVLDENGEPLVVYHGSRMAGFDKFGRGEARDSQGIYTTPNRRAAESYATSAEEWQSGQTMPEAELGVPDHHGVYSLFVNMRNPKVIDFEGKEFDRFGTPKYEVATNEALDNGERGILFDTLEEAEAYIAEHPEEDLDYVEKYTTSDDLLLQAKEEGYDGVIFTNIIDSRYPDPITNYVPFEPNQVKSATQNVGTFNPEDDRIEFMIGPVPASSMPTDPTVFDTEAANRLIVKTQKYLSKVANPNVELPKEFSAWKKFMAESYDRTEGIRWIMNSIEQYRREHGLPELGEGFDVRTMVETMESKVQNETQSYIRNIENRLRDNIRKLAKRLEGTSFYKQHKTEKIKNQSDEDVILTPVQMIERYLIARDSIEREELTGNPRGAADFYLRMGVDMVDFVNGFHSALFSTAEKKKELNELWDSVRAATDIVIDRGWESGLISYDEYQDYKKRKFYVPERDFAEVEANEDIAVEELSYHGRGSNKLAAMKQAKGGESLAANVLANICLLARDAILKANRNKVKKSMYDLLRANTDWCREYHIPIPYQIWYVKNPDGSVTRMTDGPTPEQKQQMREIKSDIRKIEDEIRNLTALRDAATVLSIKDAYDADIQDLKEQIDMLRDMMPYLDEYDTRNQIYLDGAAKNASRVVVYVDGVPTEMLFPNMTIVANALNDTFNKEGEWSWAKNSTNIAASAMTVYNPTFFTVNVVRDIPFIATKGFAEYGFTFPFRFAIELGKKLLTLDLWKVVWTGDASSISNEHLKSFYEGGANTGYSSIPDLKKLKDATKGWGKGTTVTWSNVGDVLSYLNTFSEVWTRAAAYSVVRQMGNSNEEGIRAAKNLSVNFNRKGLGNKFMNAFGSISLFMNAAIQGSCGWMRAFSGNEKTFAAKAWHATRAALGFMLAPALAGFIDTLCNPDDDENLLWYSDYDRDNYFLMGDRRIALNEQLKPFWVIGVNIALAMQGRRSTEQIINSIVSSVFTNFAPLPPVINESIVMAVNGVTGTKDVDLFDIPANLITPQAIGGVYDLANGVNFMGSKLEFDTGDKPQFIFSENEALTSRLLAKAMYYLGGGSKDVKSKTRDDGKEILFDINPKQITALRSLLPVGSTFKDITEFMLRGIVEKDFGSPEDYTTIRRFYKPREEEIAMYNIVKEAKALVKRNDEIKANMNAQLKGGEISNNEAMLAEARKRLEGALTDNDVKEIKAYIKAYEIYSVAKRAREFGLTEDEFFNSLPEETKEQIKGIDSRRPEIARKLLTMTREYQDIEVKNMTWKQGLGIEE